MALKITNSLTREKEIFEPLEPGFVRMYVCGPTVYDSPHLGHAKSYVAFDVIVRYLRHLGYRVRYVQNITDVGHLTDEVEMTGEDKIERKARAERLEPMEVVERYTREFYDAMDHLNVLRADISPRASGHIPEIITLTKTLIARGWAYESEGNVYFDVDKWAAAGHYGKLSGRDVEEQEANVRQTVTEGKRHPSDFALWKKATPDHIMRWPSPWGEGFPGWHIECSAMSMKYLGETIDIHGGGIENMFPHHEDEIAQSEAATGHPFVKTWIHNGSLKIDGVKMSKSLGNFITVTQALERWPAEVLRLFFLSSHYRSAADFSEDAIAAAEKGYDRIVTALSHANRRLDGKDVSDARSEAADAARDRFHAAMDDDFNTPAALAVLFELAGEINKTDASDTAALAALRTTLLELGGVLGLSFAAGAPVQERGIEDLMKLVLEIRQDARENRNWPLADRIRDALNEAGIVVEDGVDGTTWRVG